MLEITKLITTLDPTVFKLHTKKDFSSDNMDGQKSLKQKINDLIALIKSTIITKYKDNETRSSMIALLDEVKELINNTKLTISLK